MTSNVMQEFYRKSTLVITLPPHLCNTLEILDISVFIPLKIYINAAVRDITPLKQRKNPVKSTETG